LFIKIIHFEKKFGGLVNLKSVSPYNSIKKEWRVQISIVLAPPTLCAHKPTPFLGKIIKRRGLLS